jgi:uncharacterized membrane protein YagU involved in acid resistance
MKPNLMKSIVGGLVGTIVMTLMMRYVSPMMLGHPMDIASMLENIMGGSHAMGMAAHFINGIVIFPLAYAFLAFRYLPGSPYARGMMFGAILWLLAGFIMMPMAGAGLFGSAIGGAKAGMVALIGHLVYGVLLGAIGGAAESEAPERGATRA